MLLEVYFIRRLLNTCQHEKMKLSSLSQALTVDVDDVHTYVDVPTEVEGETEVEAEAEVETELETETPEPEEPTDATDHETTEDIKLICEADEESEERLLH